jgi:hypothetical protein
MIETETETETETEAEADPPAAASAHAYAYAHAHAYVTGVAILAPPVPDDPLDHRAAIRKRTTALLGRLRRPAQAADRWQRAIADRRRALMDDAGYPLCLVCGGRTQADGCRTCPGCAALPVAV